MLAMGAECGHSQGGNNNAYAQDNPTSWVDWSAAAGEQDLIDFVAAMCSAAGARRRVFIADSSSRGRGGCAPDGQPMTSGDWSDSESRAVTMAAPDGSFVFLINGWWEPLAFQLPERSRATAWSVPVIPPPGAPRGPSDR